MRLPDTAAREIVSLLLPQFPESKVMVHSGYED